MSSPGEWIDFAELCRRVPGKSPRTLRRYLKARLLSYRQTVTGGRMQFNWRTVARELERMDAPGVHADAVRHLAALAEPPALVAEVRALRELIEGLAGRLNAIPAGMFANEHPGFKPGDSAREVRAHRV